MAATSAPEAPPPRIARQTQRFGTIVVVGGGCYGGYYLRQLARAERAGALAWERLLVVDRDANCPAARLPAAETPGALQVVPAEWSAFFADWLDRAAADPAASAHDAIVPSPLMPHLMAGWLMDRARERWPQRTVRIAPLETVPDVRWQRAGDDGTHYVSFADWMCPINCIEPARCPHTRGPRDWSLPVALRRADPTPAPRAPEPEALYLFRCLHRAYGVGMLDVRDIVEADRALREQGEAGAATFVVGTVSHCHGALRRIVLGAATQ